MRCSPEDRFWGKVAVLGPDDCWLRSGADPERHANFWLDGKNILAHRYSYELANGPIPDGVKVDHRCHSPSCVNPRHLRAATHKQNQEHRIGARVDSASGVRGVSWHESKQKWRATARHNGKRYSFGLHASIKDAEAAARAGRNSLFTFNDHDKVPSREAHPGSLDG